MSSPRKSTLSLCFGIPGCGKTLLLKCLSKSQETSKHVSYMEINSNVTINWQLIQDIEIICISYDDIIPVVNQQLLVKQGRWKKYRTSILKACELFIAKKIQASTEPEHLSELDQEIYQRILETTSSLSVSNEKPIVFLIEDNFYYQSMRYQWFKIARQFGMGFCQIHIECSTETALKRNSARGTSIEEVVVKNIAKKLEKPDPDKNSWEKYTVILKEEWGDEVFETVIKMLRLSLEQPFTPIHCDDETRKLSRLETTESVIHQIDQKLRKTVGNIVSECHRNGCSGIKKISEDLNDARKRVLTKLKIGDIELPSNILELLLSGDDSTSKTIVEYLKNHLQAEVGNSLENNCVTHSNEMI